MNIFGHGIAGDSFRLLQEYLPLNGAVNVQKCPLSPQTQFHEGLQTVEMGSELAAVLYNIIRFLFDCAFHQFRNVMKMIIESVSVNLAPVHDILHSNLIKRPFVQEFPERLDNSIFRSVHSFTCFPILFSELHTDTYFRKSAALHYR